MNRRGFLKGIAAVPVLKGGAIPQCQLCKEFGHTMETGSIQTRGGYDYDTFNTGPSGVIVSWCPNAPMDWTFYELVR